MDKRRCRDAPIGDGVQPIRKEPTPMVSATANTVRPAIFVQENLQRRCPAQTNNNHTPLLVAAAALYLIEFTMLG